MTHSFAYPTPNNQFLLEHLKCLHQSFKHYVGRDLGNHVWDGVKTAEFLFNAPFALVSHNTASDPVFNYANQQALRLFDMNWSEFTALPSRFSAEVLERHEREQLLQTVTRQGYIDHYTGIRISRRGQRFRIENAIVWNLLNTEGSYYGQAAYFAHWHYL